MHQRGFGRRRWGPRAGPIVARPCVPVPKGRGSPRSLRSARRTWLRLGLSERRGAPAAGNHPRRGPSACRGGPRHRSMLGLLGRVFRKASTLTNAANAPGVAGGGPATTEAPRACIEDDLDRLVGDERRPSSNHLEEQRPRAHRSSARSVTSAAVPALLGRHVGCRAEEDRRCRLDLQVDLYLGHGRGHLGDAEVQQLDAAPGMGAQHQERGKMFSGFRSRWTIPRACTSTMTSVRSNGRAEMASCPTQPAPNRSHSSQARCGTPSRSSIAR